MKFFNIVVKSPHDLASTYFLELQLNTLQHTLWSRRSNTLNFLQFALSLLTLALCPLLFPFPYHLVSIWFRVYVYYFYWSISLLSIPPVFHLLVYYPPPPQKKKKKILKSGGRRCFCFNSPQCLAHS